MCCRILIDSFPSAVPIAALHGQCPGDLLQGDILFHWFAIEIYTAYGATASWTFNFYELLDAFLATGKATAQADRIQHREETVRYTILF